MKTLLILLVSLFTVGCTGRGFDRGQLQQSLRDNRVEITEEEIKSAFERKSQLSFPFKLAIFLKGGNKEHPWRTRKWTWTGPNKDALLALANKLKTDNIASDVFVISDVVVTGEDLKAIRLAAAQHGADAVLVINGAADTDQYNNYASLLYVTIVGGFIVPGTNYDALFMISGAMWDVRNQYLYATVETEGESKVTGPAIRRDSFEKESIEPAKAQAIERFSSEFYQRMRSLAGLKQ